MTRLICAAVLLSSCAVTDVETRPEPRPMGPSAGVFKLNNTVDVTGPIVDTALEPVTTRIRQLASSGRKEITLRIDSPGGSILDGNKWIRDTEDIKKANGLRFTCVVDGMAYSMAAVLLESSLCDVRLATTRSTLLFHNGSGGVRGTAEEMRQTSVFLEALNTAMALVVSARIGMPFEMYQSRISHADWIMAIPEALNNHVLDGVAAPSDIAPPSEV